MKLKNIFFLFSLLLISCSSSDQRNLENYYMGTGIVKYFLPIIPPWANFSEFYGCFRKEPMRFMDLDKVRDSFAFSYEEAIQLQYAYNLLRREMGFIEYWEKLPLKEQEKIFFKSVEQVSSNLKFFKIPEYKRIHLISIDDAFVKNDFSSLKNLMKKNIMDNGVPIFVSSCLGHDRFIKILKEQKLLSFSGLFIPTEMLGPYLSQGGPAPGLFFDMESFFGKDYTFHLFLPKGKKQHHLMGKFQIHYY